jgi:hypothetical protein
MIVKRNSLVALSTTTSRQSNEPFCDLDWDQPPKRNKPNYGDSFWLSFGGAEITAFCEVHFSAAVTPKNYLLRLDRGFVFRRS